MKRLASASRLVPRSSIAFPPTPSTSSGARPSMRHCTVADGATTPRIRAPHWHGQLLTADWRPSILTVLSRRTLVNWRQRDGPKRATSNGLKLQERASGSGDRGQRQDDGSRRFPIPPVVGAFFKSILFVIPSIMFWMHFFSTGLYAISEEESEEENAINQRLIQFFDIQGKVEEEINSEWNQKLAAVTDLSVRLLKSPNLAKVLRGSGFEANYVLYTPPGEVEPDSSSTGEEWQSEWKPRMIFSSSAGVVIGYARFLPHNNKWVPVEIHLVDAALESRGVETPWKMEGQLPHGVSFQRLPPKPMDS